MRKSERAWRQAEEALADAHRKAEASFGVAFPVGRRVAWYHNCQSKHVQNGKVIISQPEYRQVKVLNERTGREIWLRAYDLLRADQAAKAVGHG